MKFIKRMNQLNKTRVDETYCDCANITYKSILEDLHKTDT